LPARRRNQLPSAVRRWAWITAGVTVVLLVATAALWVAARPDHHAPAATRVVVAGAADPSAVVALDDGGFRYAERRTGNVREVDRRGRLLTEPIAHVAVRSEPGQRGLLGLAVDRGGDTYAAWTRSSDGHLVVGRVAPGATRLVWEGPTSTKLANGGRLAFTPEGRLLIGVGELERPQSTPDPAAPNGKLLSLDPRAEPSQEFRVVSSGWHNPFAFTYARGDRLWLADNAPGNKSERITRGDRKGAPVATTGDLRPLAPSALVPLGKSRLGLCGYVSRVMREIRLDGDRPSPPGRVLVDHCAIAAAMLADGRVVVTDDSSVRVTLRPLT